MKKTYFIIFLMISFILLNCNSKSELIGKWEGTRFQKTWLNDKYQSNHEMEFSNDGKGWQINYDPITGEKYHTEIFEYRLIDDSIYFTELNGEKWSGGIELLTKHKLILNKPKNLGTSITYDLNKN